MKISGYGSIGSTTSTSKRGSVSSTTSFADVLAAQEADLSNQVSPTNDVAATAALNNLLALQEISEEDVKRKRLTQQGKNMLDSLDKLRAQLLTGSVPLHTLQELGRQLRLEKQAVADPRLHAIIDDIELRTAVELAKLERARQEAEKLPL